MQHLSELKGTTLEISMPQGNEKSTYTFNSFSYQAVASILIAHVYKTWPVARCM